MAYLRTNALSFILLNLLKIKLLNYAIILTVLFKFNNYFFSIFFLTEKQISVLSKKNI